MNHVNEARIEELIASGASISEIEAHFEDCPDCFQVYMDMVELAYDATRPLEEGVSNRIAAAVRAGMGEVESDESSQKEAPPGATGRPVTGTSSGLSAWYAAALVLIGLGIGLVASRSWESAPEEAHLLTARLGQCEIIERRGDFGGAPRVRQLSSGPRSVCEISFGADYRLRLLEGVLSIPGDPAEVAYAFESGVLAVERSSDRPLAIRMGELNVTFQGTRAVLNRKQESVQVTHGAVEVSGPGLEEPLRVAADQQLRSGTVEALPDETREASERLFRDLPANASETQLGEIIPDLFPDQEFIRQRLFLNDGRVLEGLVAQEGDTFTVVTRSGTTRVNKSEVGRVQFVR